MHSRRAGWMPGESSGDLQGDDLNLHTLWKLAES